MRRASAAAFVLCAALARCNAFTVTSEPVRSMDSTDPRRVLEQRYVVAQPLMDSVMNRETLQTLKIAMPGRVFVSYNYDLRDAGAGREWTEPAVTVRFSGNTEDVFKFFEVTSTAPHTLEVKRRADVRGIVDDAYLLTEISITQSHTVRTVETSGSGDVVIEDQVLVTDAQSPLSLQLSGSGDVYVDSKSSVATAALHVASKGSGGLFWTAGTLQTQSYKLELSGSGDITMLGQSLDTTSVEVSIAGSGDICVDAASINTGSLSTATAGSGTISFSSASGHCNNEAIAILGAGEVYVGSIQCNDVKVAIAGAGDVYVQAVHSISGTAWGAGDVRFVGVTPQLISDRYDANVFSTEQSKKYKPIAKHKDRNKQTMCKPKIVPLREAVHVRGAFWEGALGSSSAVLGPLVFFALLSLCYLRCQRKRSRRDPRPRVPRFASYHQPSAQELQPLQPQYPPMAYQPQQQYQPHHQQQQQQQYHVQPQQAQSNSQVYV